MDNLEYTCDLTIGSAPGWPVHGAPVGASVISLMAIRSEGLEITQWQWNTSDHCSTLSPGRESKVFPARMRQT